jgi:hypothetical protein
MSRIKKIKKGEVLDLNKILRTKELDRFAAKIKEEVRQIIEKYSKK